MLRRASLGGLLMLTSCGGAAPDADRAAPAPVTAPVPASGTPSVAVPPPVAAASGTPSVAVPPPAEPAAAPAAKLEFHPVVTSDELLGLHPLLDGSLMISAGPRLLRVDPAGVIDEGPALLAGIALPDPQGLEMGPEGLLELINERGGWRALQVGGTWPGATFLTLENGRRRPGDVYRWTADRWVKTRPGRPAVSSWPRTIRAWKDRSLLAWRELHVPALDLDSQCSSCPPELFETPAYKRGERDLAGTRQLVVLAGPAKGPPLAGETITAFDALTSGEVFVALADGSLRVLPAAGAPVTVKQPAGAGSMQLHGLVARAADDVLGFGARAGKAYLVRYDGAALEALDVPACEPGLASLAIAGSTWWATCASTVPRSYDELNAQPQAGSLWRREGAGPWERVALADGLAARLVVARGPADVWVSAYGEPGGAVLHTRKRDRTIALGSLLDIVRAGFFPAQAGSAATGP